MKNSLAFFLHHLKDITAIEFVELITVVSYVMFIRYFEVALGTCMVIARLTMHHGNVLGNANKETVPKKSQWHIVIAVNSFQLIGTSRVTGIPVGRTNFRSYKRKIPVNSSENAGVKVVVVTLHNTFDNKFSFSFLSQWSSSRRFLQFTTSGWKIKCIY